MQLAAGLFEEHDRERYEVFAYSLAEDDGGEYRKRLRAAIEHFVDVRALGAHEIAERIRADGIEITDSLWMPSTQPTASTFG